MSIDSHLNSFLSPSFRGVAFSPVSTGFESSGFVFFVRSLFDLSNSVGVFLSVFTTLMSKVSLVIFRPFSFIKSIALVAPVIQSIFSFGVFSKVREGFGFFAFCTSFHIMTIPMEDSNVKAQEG